MEDIEIWRAAEQMRKLYGDDAAIQAATRADKPRDQGDTESFDMRKRVVAAINELDRVEVKDGEAKL